MDRSRSGSGRSCFTSTPRCRPSATISCSTVRCPGRSASRTMPARSAWAASAAHQHGSRAPRTTHARTSRGVSARMTGSTPCGNTSSGCCEAARHTGGVNAGRYAPSPSGDLHVGNLRTALLAWLWARRSGRDFLIRIEDLDRVRPGAEQRQLDDLRALGLDWDGTPVRQSDRLDLYAAAITRLRADGLVYECFCTRREILEAPTAPHHPPGAYPGTCRELTDAERSQRRTERPAALRLRSGVTTFTV